MDDELDYRGTQVSPLDPIGPDKQDIATRGAIKRAQAILANRIAGFDSIDSLTVVNEEDFTVKEQLAMNKHMKIIILEAKGELDEAVESFEE